VRFLAVQHPSKNARFPHSSTLISERSATTRIFLETRSCSSAAERPREHHGIPDRRETCLSTLTASFTNPRASFKKPRHERSRMPSYRTVRYDAAVRVIHPFRKPKRAGARDDCFRDFGSSVSLFLLLPLVLPRGGASSSLGNRGDPARRGESCTCRSTRACEWHSRYLDR